MVTTEGDFSAILDFDLAIVDRLALLSARERARLCSRGGTCLERTVDTDDSLVRL